MEEETQRCRRCGTYTWEWQYLDEQGKWQMRRDIHREADVWTCFGCKGMDEVLETLSHRGKVHGAQVRWFPRADREVAGG